MNSTLFTRPNKPRTTPVKARDTDYAIKVEVKKPLTLSKDTECFVTPPWVARRMVEALNIQTGDSILEPQAGTGQLVDAIYKSLSSPTGRFIDRMRNENISVTTVEKNFALAKTNGWFCHDFLDWSAANVETSTRFDKIICNPPFKTVKAHMRAAKVLLKSGGIMIALVPSTYKDIDHKVLEELGPDTFKAAKVHTKIIEIRG